MLLIVAPVGAGRNMASLSAHMKFYYSSICLRHKDPKGASIPDSTRVLCFTN